MNNLMDSLELNSSIRNEIKILTKNCIIRPSLAYIEIKSDNNYGKILENICNKLGIYFRYYEFESDTPELTIINKIKELNNDDYVDGIMVSLPVLGNHNEKRILNSIINSKDVDGLTDINIGRLMSSRKTLVPSIANSIVSILKENKVEFNGKSAIIVGNYNSVSKSLMSLLLNEGLIVTMCNDDISCKKYVECADIVINTFDRKVNLTKDMIKNTAIVIDSGFSYENEKLVSSFDKSVSENAMLYLTNKEVGMLSISLLLKNTIMCYNKKNK